MSQFAELASPLRHRLECQARRTVHADAEDLVGDVYLDAMQSLSVFYSDPSEHALYAWLLHLLRQRVSRWKREHDRETALTPEALAQAERVREEAAEEAFERMVRCHEVQRRLSLAPLTPLARVCIVAHMQGERQQVTATRLCLSVGAVAMQVQRAKAVLRAVPDDLVSAADLDGYAWRAGNKVTIYRRPKRTGAGLAEEKLRALTLKPIRKRPPPRRLAA